MVLSTCLSDAALALACAGCARWLGRSDEPTRRFGAVGMVLMAAAATLGAVRYGGVESLRPVHVGVSHLAGAVAPASFGLVAVALARGSKPEERRLLAGAIGVLVLAWALFEFVIDFALYRTLIGAVGVVLMLGVAAKLRTGAAVRLAVGGLGLALAGLVIGTKGQLGPLPAIDVFHVVLALAHGLVAWGLAELRR